MKAFIFRDGALVELPECENCGAPIYKPGLCRFCASFAQEVKVVTVVSEQVVINPEDLV